MKSDVTFSGFGQLGVTMYILGQFFITFSKSEVYIHFISTW